MALTRSWSRLVKSNTEVVFGYKDCVAALQEGLWQDAAKLLCVHGFEDALSCERELITTSLRYHLEFYECGICGHHAARLTTDDLIEHKWRSRLDYTEAYRGESVRLRTTLRHFGSAPAHLARSTAGCFRHVLCHANPTDLNKLAWSIMSIVLIAAGLAFQSRQATRAREMQTQRRLHPALADVRSSNQATHSFQDTQRTFAEYYQIAIGQGNSRERAYAANVLGEMYEKGVGTKRDYGGAILWYRIASQHSNSDAMMNLGRLYEKGIGVRKDLVTAKFWYASAGDKESADRVSHLKR